MATTYSGRTFTVGDRVTFTKFANSIYATSYNAQSGQLGTLTGTIKTLYASSYNFPIVVTSVSNSSTSFSYDFTIKPADATKGYKVTVTYNHNGGSGTGSQSGYVGASLSGTSSRTGYTFAGWYTSSSGGSRVTTVPANAATYYAHWTAKTYKVTFNANGGSGSTSVNETYGSHYSMPSSPTRTGYTFAGWYTSQSGGTRVTSSTTMTTASAHTLYAHWTAHTYTVTFNGNGASGSAYTQSFTYGVSKALSANSFSRGAAYAFTGWNKSANGSGTAYKNQQTVSNLTSTNNGNVNLYAQWQLQYLAPSITNISAIRSDSSGNEQDDGQYLHLTCTCKANTAVSSTNKITEVKIKTKTRSSSSYTLLTTISGLNVATYNLSFTSVSASFSTDIAYDIQIEVTDSYGGTVGISAPQAKATTFLSKAFFTMDFAAGGEGVGIGMPAPSSGLDVGLNTSFHNQSYVSIRKPYDANAETGAWYQVRMINVANVNDDSRMLIGIGATGFNRGIYLPEMGTITSPSWLIRHYYTGNRIEIGDGVSDIRLMGHSSSIGALLSDDGSKSLASGTSMVKIADPFALPTGSWIIFAGVQFPDNSTGTRAARLYFGGTASGTAYAAYPSGAGVRAMSIGAVMNVTGSTLDVDLYARQNSGSAMTVTYYVRAMRIA